MINQDLAKIFYEMSAYLEMADERFRSLAYNRAAHTVEALSEDLAEIYKKEGVKGLEGLTGIGKSLACHIEEYIKTEKIENYETLKKKIPVKLNELTAIEGVGPKMVKKLYGQLGIKDVADLEKMAKGGKIRELAGFGEKSEQKILKGIEFLKRSAGRFTLGEVLPIAREIKEGLKGLKEVKEIEVCGSLRRRKETVGDLDILVISDRPQIVMDFFTTMPMVDYIYAKGETKSSVRLKNNLDVDLRVVPRESFGAALQYFTGSKDHNVALREIAIKKGCKLNEYGLLKGEKFIAGKYEEEIYKKLGLAWIPPEIREDSGEIEAAKRQFQGKSNGLPKLISYQELKGDLQVQTNWSDGANTIEEMAQRAISLGLEYIAITDHTKSLKVAGGLDEKSILKQCAEIDKIDKKFQSQGITFRLLKGSEVDILPDGSLDINDEVLARLDVVGASVHSHFNLPRQEQTERIKRAMANENVDIFFHPTGRVIKGRPPYDVDIEEIIKFANETGTILEINAFPDRLDLKDLHIRTAINEGVLLSIDSDAHNIYHLNYLEYGISQARRGWAEKEDVINTRSLQELIEFFRMPKRQR